MTRSIGGVIGPILMIAVSAMVCWSAEPQQSGKTPPESRRESMYRGKPLSYWLKSLRDRDDEIPLAFDAIVDLGPDAWSAVDELTRIVAEPFTAIRIGVDRDASIARKLSSIRLHSGAIDALAAIGEAAAPSTLPLIQWALTVRVIPINTDDVTDYDLLVDLITVDTLERMRVAGAVAQFGPAAAPAVVALLESPDDEKRKLGVAILSQNALPIVGQLLKSRNCEQRTRGFAILADMWPVVAKEHLAELKTALVCIAK